MISRRPNDRKQRNLRVETLESRRLLATYYVSQIDGHDSNSGTSDTEAWATLERLQQQTLSPGDVIRLKRGSDWNEYWQHGSSSTADNPILVATYGIGADPIVNRLRVNGAFSHFRDLVVDRARQSGDAIIVRAEGVMLKDMVVRNGASDGIDAHRANGLVIDGLLIHHFLAGSYTDQVDAHGIVATSTNGLTIRNCEIHHVSGDSFQADPDRDTEITTNVLIEKSHFWTGPLAQDFNDWNAGQRPGENAVDTKVVKSDWDTVERMQITIREVVAHGWVKDGYISNKAAFNMKEKVDAIFDRVTVYDSEIAFRLRGTRGNANVTIINSVMYDLEKAIRAEDDLANLRLYNSTFGDGIDTTLQFAGGSGGIASWDVRNNAFLSPLPSVASDPSNRQATAADFVDSAKHDYRLSNDSLLVDGGVSIVGVDVDRDGNQRPQGPANDIGAYENILVYRAVVDDVTINQGQPQRSAVTELTVTFNRIVDIASEASGIFTVTNKTTGETVQTEVSSQQVDGRTVVTLSFLPGESVTEGGSLDDGDYELKIDAARVTANGVPLDGTGDGDIGRDFIFGDETADAFYRMYGDVDGSQSVGLFDFLQFRAAYLATEDDAHYRAHLDHNGDDRIDIADFVAFRSNYGR